MPPTAPVPTLPCGTVSSTRPSDRRSSVLCSAVGGRTRADPSPTVPRDQNTPRGGGRRCRRTHGNGRPGRSGSSPSSLTSRTRPSLGVFSSPRGGSRGRGTRCSRHTYVVVGGSLGSPVVGADDFWTRTRRRLAVTTLGPAETSGSRPHPHNKRVLCPVGPGVLTQGDRRDTGEVGTEGGRGRGPLLSDFDDRAPGVLPEAPTGTVRQKGRKILDMYLFINLKIFVLNML